MSQPYIPTDLYSLRSLFRILSRQRPGSGPWVLSFLRERFDRSHILRPYPWNRSSGPSFWRFLIISWKWIRTLYLSRCQRLEVVPVITNLADYGWTQIRREKEPDWDRTFFSVLGVLGKRRGILERYILDYKNEHEYMWYTSNNSRIVSLFSYRLFLFFTSKTKFRENYVRYLNFHKKKR